MIPDLPHAEPAARDISAAQGPIKCVVLFSGGLDSAVAAHMLKAMGLEVTALHFVLPLTAPTGNENAFVRSCAATIGVDLVIQQEGEEFVELLRNPKHGFGKNANPCIDCRIGRLVKARVFMEKIGARFLATGEVVGQRPMSQKRHIMDLIERTAGVSGILLRPLCARLLEPTIPEQQGWVDRSQLLSLSGRGRIAQLAYAARFGLQHGSPAGGCVLAEAPTALRLRELRAHTPDFDLGDVRLMVYGRRFRISGNLVLAVSRTGEENLLMLSILDQQRDIFFDLASIPGPMAIARGSATAHEIRRCAAMVARFSKARNHATVDVVVKMNGRVWVEAVVPATAHECSQLQIEKS